MRKCFVTQYCVLSSQITSVGYVGNVICLKFVQESFKVLFEKELVKNMMYLVWELNPRLSVHETDTLPSELMRFYICQHSSCNCSSEGRGFKPSLADVKPR